MQLDPASYLRLDVPHSLGATAAGASFATSSGDILDIECFGEGIFRLRLGPDTRPDYGIVVARAKDCTVAQRLPGVWTFTAGDSVLEISGSPLRIKLSWKGGVVLTSITDEHAHGTTRLPTFGRLRQGGLWTAAFALASGEPVYGLGEKFGPLDKRGQLIHSRVEDALGVNTGLAYKNTPFAWSPGTGKGAWGTFIHTPGMVTHGVGHPDWSHRSYAVMVEEEALDLFLFAGATPAAIVDGYTHLTGRPAPVPRWSLGLWVSRAAYPTPDDAIAIAAKLRARKIPADVLIARWRPRMGCRNAFRFQLGSTAVRRSCRHAGEDQGARPSRVRLGIPLRVGKLATLPGAGVAAIPAADAGRRSVRVLVGRAGGCYVPWLCAIVARERNRRFHESRCLRVVARRTSAAVRRWRRCDQQRLRRAGARGCRRVQRRQRRSAAQRFPAPLQPLRLRGNCAISGAFRRPARHLEPLRVGRKPALSNRLGWRSAERLGRSRSIYSRRPFVGDERQSVPQRGRRRSLRLDAAVRGTVRALASGRRVLVAYAAARDWRPRALGVRRRGGRGGAQVARDALPADSLHRTARRAGRRDRHAGHARDAARIPRQPARPRLRIAVHVRRCAARRAHRARRRRRRHRAAAGRVVRPQFPRALSWLAGAAVRGAARPVPRVRTRRPRAAAWPRRAAHR